MRAIATVENYCIHICKNLSYIKHLRIIINSEKKLALALEKRSKDRSMAVTIKRISAKDYLLLPLAILWRLGPGTRALYIYESNLIMVERLEKAGVRSYLFCVGLDLLGGIFRKLESTCLKGSLSALRACEHEAATLDIAFVQGRRAASAPLGQVCRIKKSAKTKAANVLEWAFMMEIVCPTTILTSRGRGGEKKAFKVLVKCFESG